MDKSFLQVVRDVFPHDFQFHRRQFINGPEGWSFSWFQGDLMVIGSVGREFVGFFLTEQVCEFVVF